MADTTGINPNADSAYLAKSGAAADQQNTDAFLARVAAMDDASRRAELAKYGISQDEYDAAIGAQNSQALQERQAKITPAQAESEGRAVEGAEPGAQRLGRTLDRPDQADEPYLDPVDVYSNAIGFGRQLVSAGISIPRAMLGTAAATEFMDLVNKRARDWFPNHPALASAAATVVGPLLLIGGVKGLDQLEGLASRVTGGAASPAGEAASAAGAEAGAGAGGAATADGAGETPAPVAAEQSAPATEVAATTSETPAETGATEPQVETPAKAGAAAAAESPSSAQPSAGGGEATGAAARIYTDTYNRDYLAAVEDARRGVVARATQQQAAAAAPATPEDIAGIERGTAAPAERAIALSNFIRDEGNTIRDLAGKALDEGDTAARAEALQRIDSLVSVYDPKVQGVIAETGRALGAFNKPTPALYGKMLRAEVLSKIGTPGYMTEDEVLNAFRGIQSPEEFERLAQRIGGGGTDSYATNFFINSYISSILSPNSVAKKAASDVLNIAYQIPARALGEAAGYAQRAAGTPAEQTITPGETAAMIRAINGSFRDAMNIGWESTKANRPLFQEGVGYGESIPQREISAAGTRFEGTPIGSGIDWYGHLVSVPGRAIIGVDQAAKVFHFRMELGALAEHQGYITALNEGRSGADFAARAGAAATSFMSDPPQWAIDAAYERSKVETFQREMTGTLEGIDRLRQSSWIARTIIPFFRTGTNIVRMGLERTVPFSTQAWREAWQAGGRERTLMVAKNAMGDLTAAYFAHKYLNDELTGYGPRNASVRALWLKTHQPYSLKVAGHWFSLAPTEPVAWIAGVIGDAGEMMAHLPSQDAWSVADAVSAATVREFNRQGFWDDLASSVHTLDEMSQKGVDAKGVSSALGGLVGTIVVPQAFNDVAHGIDPVRRQTTGFLDGIRSRIPYLTEGGIPTRDPWGKVIVVPPGFLMNEFPAFRAVPEGKDAVDDEMVRLYHAINYMPPPVPKAIGGPAASDNPLAIQNFRDGVSLTPEVQDRWAELRGNIKDPRSGYDLKQAVAHLMRDPRYNDLSDQGRAQRINRIFVGYREAAKRQLAAEHPELVQQLVALKQQRRETMATPGPEVNLGEGGGAGGIEAP